jgi:thiol-activated cytolysin
LGTLLRIQAECSVARREWFLAFAKDAAEMPRYPRSSTSGTSAAMSGVMAIKYRSLHTPFCSVLGAFMLAGLTGCGGGVAATPGDDEAPTAAAEAEDEGAPSDTGSTDAADEANPAQPDIEQPAADDNSIRDLLLGAGDIDSDVETDGEPHAIGTQTTSTVQGEGGEFQCTIEQYSLTKTPDRFVVVNPNAGVLWPGAMVQGASIQNGVLDPVPAERAPGYVTLDLVSGADAAFTSRVESPRHGSTTQAVNDILRSYLADSGGTPAKFSYTFSEVYSKEQLAVAIDAKVSGATWDLAAALDFDASDEKSRVLLQFNQEYYTVAFEPEEVGPNGFFAPEVTADDLDPYVGPGNPPLYVSGVTYGRTFYLMFESTASAKALHAAISGSYNAVALSAQGSVSADWKKVINESTVKSYGIGGDAEKAIAAATGATQFEQIQSFLVAGATFSIVDVGVPISYTLRYPSNGKQVKLALTTEFGAKDCVPVGAPGCDGVPHSGKQVDACGVCGGDGTGCNPCAAKVDYNNHDHGTWVNFSLPGAAHGTTKSWADGTEAKYIFPTCRRVKWENIAFQCQNGSWNRISGSTAYADALCHNDGNTNQSGLATFAD